MLSHQVNYTNWQASDLEPEGYRPEQVSYHSGVIELVKSSCKRMKSPSVLQIGRVGPGFLEFVSEIKGKLVTCEPETTEGASLLEYLLGSPKIFDVMFVWDRLLYDDIIKKSDLLNLIECSSKMGSSLMVYSSTRKAIPTRPCRFYLTPNSGIDMVPTTTITADANVFEVGKQLPNWRCMKATQLRNGFREHLLVKRS